MRTDLAAARCNRPSQSGPTARQLAKTFPRHQDEVFVVGPVILAGQPTSHFECVRLIVSEQQRGVMLDREKLVRDGDKNTAGDAAQLADK